MAIDSIRFGGIAAAVGGTAAQHTKPSAERPQPDHHS